MDTNILKQGSSLRGFPETSKVVRNSLISKWEEGTRNPLLKYSISKLQLITDLPQGADPAAVGPKPL